MKRNSFVYIFKVVQVSTSIAPRDHKTILLVGYLDITIVSFPAYNSRSHCNDSLPSDKDASWLSGGWSYLLRCHVSWIGDSSVQWLCWTCDEYCKTSHILQTKRPSVLSIMGICTAYMDSENSHIVLGVCRLDSHDILRHWIRSKHRKVRSIRQQFREHCVHQWPKPFVLCRFFRHYLLLVLISQLASGLFRLLAAVGREMVVADTFGSFAQLVLLILGGFLISRGIENLSIMIFLSQPDNNSSKN